MNNSEERIIILVVCRHSEMNGKTSTVLRQDKKELLGWKSNYLVSHGNMSQHSRALIDLNSSQRTNIFKVVCLSDLTQYEFYTTLIKFCLNVALQTTHSRISMEMFVGIYRVRQTATDMKPSWTNHK